MTAELMPGAGIRGQWRTALTHNDLSNMRERRFHSN